VGCGNGPHVCVYPFFFLTNSDDSRGNEDYNPDELESNPDSEAEHIMTE